MGMFDVWSAGGKMKRKELAREQAKERIRERLEDTHAFLWDARLAVNAEDYSLAKTAVQRIASVVGLVADDLQQFLPGE